MGPVLSPADLASADQAEEFAAGGGVVAEFAEHHRSDHGRVLLFHAAHHHAHVLGLDHHRDAEGAGDLLDRLGDLPAHVLLDLQAAGVHVDDPRDLRQAEHLAVRDIGHVGLADEGQQVVLAERVQLDVLDQYHFAVVGAEQGTVDDFFQALLVAAAQVLHGLGGTLGRVQQTFAVNVLAELGEDRGVVLFQGHGRSSQTITSAEGRTSPGRWQDSALAGYSSRPSSMVLRSIT
ncbi:hypothetical protein PAMH19_5013 [Pseudomonas aeruginosa]|nr:hypothetical protein PAMH19_5013 [Pseudomonas aeruginosa]